MIEVALYLELKSKFKNLPHYFIIIHRICDKNVKYNNSHDSYFVMRTLQQQHTIQRYKIKE